MRRTPLNTMCALALCAVAVPIAAQDVSLQDQRRAAKAQAEFVDPLNLVNKACGTKLSVEVDWKSFAGAKDLDGQSISDQCAVVLDGIRDICDDAAGKKAVAAKVRTYTCAYGGPGKRSIDYKGGAINYHFDVGASNSRDFAKEKLEAKL